MSKQFDHAFDLIIGVEGGYVNHPSDTPTNWGITIETLSSVLKRTATLNDIKSLSKEAAKNIYKDRYWDRMKLDLIADETIQYLLFDSGVNFGTGTVIKRLQQLLKLPLTMNMDISTIKAINESKRLKFCFDFVKETMKAYISIVKSNPEKMIFFTGWSNRVFNMYDIIRQSVEIKA